MKILVNKDKYFVTSVLFNGKLTEVKFFDDEEYNIDCQSKKLNDSLESLRKLTDTTLFKETFPEEDSCLENVSLNNMNMKYSNLYQYNLYDSIFTNELIYIKSLYGEQRGLDIKSIVFVERDNDIKEALINKKISPIIASTLICVRNLREDNEELYTYYKIAKKKPGEFRDIYEPNEKLKDRMRNLNRILQKFFDTKENKKETNQFAYIKDRNIVGNAKVHRNNQTIVKVDISKFFESIKFEYVERYLKFLCKDRELLEEFSECIINPETKGLYMGNPISGTLANLMMYKVSRSLESIFNKRNMAVSIYSDDITVSTNEKISKEMVVSIIEYVFNGYKLDLGIKSEKTKKLKKQNRRVCGITINSNNEITTKRSDYEMARVMLHKLSRGENITVPVSTLIGRLNFYRYVDETGKFNRLFDKYSDLLNELGFKYENKVECGVL